LLAWKTVATLRNNQNMDEFGGEVIVDEIATSKRLSLVEVNRNTKLDSLKKKKKT
jgi:hypothetical protein